MLPAGGWDLRGDKNFSCNAEVEAWNTRSVSVACTCGQAPCEKLRQEAAEIWSLLTVGGRHILDGEDCPYATRGQMEAPK